MGGTTVEYLVDSQSGYGDVVAEYVNGSKAKTYAIGDDLISQTVGNATFYYGYDGLGSTRMLFADTGTVSDSYDYTAFGEIHGQSGSTDNTFLFTGEQFDSNVGQYYLRARYYNQAVGRFTQLDAYQGSMSDPATLHKYLYTGNDPVNMIDPTGHMSIMSVSFSMPSLSIAAVSTAEFAIGRGLQAGVQMVLRSQLIESRILAATNGIEKATKGIRIVNKMIKRTFRNKKFQKKLKEAGNRLFVTVQPFSGMIDAPKITGKTSDPGPAYSSFGRMLNYRVYPFYKAGRVFEIKIRAGKKGAPATYSGFFFRVDYLDYKTSPPQNRPHYHIAYPGKPDFGKHYYFDEMPSFN